MGLLGRGGSAVVELAVDPSGRRVATKRVALAGSAAQIHAARVRLRREAQVLGALAHPGIVAVLDVIDDGADVVLVLPAMAENLEDRVHRLGPRPSDEVAAVGWVLLGALAAAHRAGVVHRDIKPANVLFDGQGRPALADFGAALSADMTAGLTGAGSVVGTPMWMAPEQARGGRAGPASDVFSLAATLAFAASGAGPYPPGPPLAIMERAARGQVLPVPPTLPAGLRDALAIMLDPDPSRRPSAAALLGGVGGTISAPARPAVTPERAAAGTRPRLRAVGRRLAGDPPAGPAHRRWPIIASLVAAATVAALVAVAMTGPPSGLSSASPPPTACTPQVYRPCGTAAPAPNTDGVACLPGWYDLDGSTADGCESRSDYSAGTVLTARAAVRANLVPPDSTDTFGTHVSGHAMDLCWGSLQVTLTAPTGTAERLQVRRRGAVLASAVSAGGTPATVTVGKPSCIGSDSEDLTVTVTGVAATGASSASDFTLVRDGGW